MKVILNFENENQFKEFKSMVEEFGTGFKVVVDEKYWEIIFKEIDYFSHKQTSYEIRDGIKFFGFYDGDFEWITIE